VVRHSEQTPPTAGPRFVIRLVRHPAFRAIVAGVAVVGGVCFAMIGLALGSCGFAGGTCPAPAVPWWEDDVFGVVATGSAVAVGVPLVAWRPDRRGFVAGVAGALATLPVAWLLVNAARTGVP
jgi:hypothetical protein